MKAKRIVLALMCMMLMTVFTTPAFASTGYRPTNGKIAEATSVHDKAINGRLGDRSGKELKVKRYSYGGGKHSHSWKFVVRCTDPVIADRAATFAKQVCKSKKFGYNQYVNNQKGINRRNSLYLSGKKANFNISKMEKADTSCTPLSLIGFRAAGINMDYKIRCFYHCRRTGSYTGTYCCGTVNAESLKSAIKRVNREYVYRGEPAPFKIIYLKKSQFKKPKKYLKRGDVVCTGSHTAIMQ